MSEDEAREEEMYEKIIQLGLRKFSDPEFRRKYEEWKKEQKYEEVNNGKEYGN